MEYSELGSTGKLVSRIAFGCWGIGGHGYGDVDDKQSIKAIHTALDYGINFFDTAGTYGFGHSETVLGKALATSSKEAFVATKFGVNWDDSGKTFISTAKEQIIQSVEDSLQRLQLDSIPLLQMHQIDEATPVEDIADTLQELKDAGKVQSIGLCNVEEAFTQKLMELIDIQSIQNKFNILHPAYTVSKETLAKHKISLLPYEVLLRGLLSGKYQKPNTFNSNDTRSRDANFSGNLFQNNLICAKTIKTIAEHYNVSAAALTIRWTLDQPYVSSVLIGMRTPEHVLGNVQLCAAKLNSTDRLTLNELHCKILRDKPNQRLLESEPI